MITDLHKMDKRKVCYNYIQEGFNFLENKFRRDKIKIFKYTYRGQNF